MIKRGDILSAEYFTGLEKLSGCVPLDAVAKNGVAFTRLAAAPAGHPFRVRMWLSRSALKARVLMTSGAVIFRDRNGAEQIRRFGADENGFPAVLDRELRLVNTHGMEESERKKHQLGVDLENPQTSPVRLSVCVVLRQETHAFATKPSTSNGVPRGEPENWGVALHGLYSDAELVFCGDGFDPVGRARFDNGVIEDALVSVASCAAQPRTETDAAAAQGEDWEPMTTSQLIFGNIAATGLFFDGFQSMSLGVYRKPEEEDDDGGETGGTGA